VAIFGGTGYGKCLKGDEVLLVYEEGKGWRFERIGELVERIFEEFSEKIGKYDDETEVVFGEALPKAFYVFAVDPVNLTPKITSIRAFVRVKAPDKLYRVVLESGREVVVTGGHNFLAVKNGTFGVYRTTELGEGCKKPVISGDGGIWYDETFANVVEAIRERTRLDENGVVVEFDSREDATAAATFLSVNGVDYVVDSENGTYRIVVLESSVSRFGEILDVYEDYDCENESVKLEVSWECVEKIEVLENHGEKYVYDLSTGYETFLAGLGGIFVHNTTLLVNMMVQDMEAGRGFCFIDPKGDAIEEVLMRVPEHRIKDVVVIDPANYDKVVGLNFLEVVKRSKLSEAQINAIKELIVSDLVALMKQQTNIWGERFGRIFETLIRAILDYNETAPPEEQLTFLDLYVLLTNEEVRKEFAESVKDPIIREYLNKISEMPEDVMEPVIRRLNDWVMNKVVRQVVSHRRSSIDFREAIDTGKIILVRIPKGEVGYDIMQLVGLTVISKIWAAAKSRVDTPPERREPFILYVDEFSNFAFEGSTFDEILSEARAFKLGLVLATQYPSQLSPEIREAVYGNCGTIIAFNPQNPNDASMLIKRFPGIKVEDLLSLGLYKIMARIVVNNELTEPFVLETYPPSPPLRDREQIREIVERSLEIYGRERMSETDLSESLRKLQEITKAPVKDSSVNDALAVVYALMVRFGENVKITYDLFESEAKKRGLIMDSVKYADVIEVLERMGAVEREMDPATGIVYVVPVADRVRELFWSDKLTGYNAGKLEHRHLVRNVYEFFAKKGFVVDVKPHAGRSVPDIIVRLPPPPVGASLEDVERHISELKKEGLWDLTGGKDAVVEIEITGHSKPGELLKKLAKYFRSKKTVIYVVQGKGSDFNEYVSEAIRIHKIIEDMRGKKGPYKLNEVLRDHKGRKLWEHETTGAIAYEYNGALYDAETNEAVCLVREAKDRGWKPKRAEFDPQKEFPDGLPTPMRDYRILIFPPDGTDIPVIELLPPRAPARTYKFVPLDREGLKESDELTKVLKEYLRRMREGKDVSFVELWREVTGEPDETEIGKEIAKEVYEKLKQAEEKVKRRLEKEKSGGVSEKGNA